MIETGSAITGNKAVAVAVDNTGTKRVSALSCTD